MEAKVAVFGLGHVGRPLAEAFARKGLPVVGVDTATEVREALRARWKGERLRVTGDASQIGKPEACLLALPTPVRNGRTDLSAIFAVLESLRPRLRGMLLVLESTVPPGTTEETLAPWLEKRGFRPGREVFLAYSPERINPGSGPPLEEIPKLIAGVTEACLHRAMQLYRQVFRVLVPVSRPWVAEMAKVVENTFRNLNIAFVNEVLQICMRKGLSTEEVLQACATKGFGFMRFTPGLGVGGNCIPLAPLYLAETARKLGLEPRLSLLGARINDGMPGFWVSALEEALDGLQGKQVLVWGVTYKPGVPDTRHSPALLFLEALEERGARAHFWDPLVQEVTLSGEKRRAVHPEAQDWDAVVLVHSFPEEARSRMRARLWVDVRAGELRTWKEGEQ